mmetsp:Transcript_14070/g.20794  ORF Transcript_14070/g.20794 Transcript_14070/m.20794 type:complete len:307 (+) Transcript_14070:20-940(+)|eukprot:CAMPEP_0171462700 /NCGR_PEP_ID=MMETSP0945-20130129/6627_1 /TAXON_ID=109269 /ORGANISM="Vaucheria litorea, Strain CCMP2940" /LENGTH=306 /DNA_ID=CAMNT_0011989267 /DNA_START=20 /DNA_END=940 /DNA_ORIENTATION=-
MKTSHQMRNIALFAFGLITVESSSDVAIDPEGGFSAVRKTLISNLYQGLPYDGLIPIPGVIEAEYFDVGGQDVAYNNIEANIPMPDNVFRFEENGEEITLQINDVAASTNPGSSEEDGAIAIGMGMSGEWMRYSVTVPVTGKYLPTWRIATFDGDDGPAYVGVKLVLGNGAEVNPCLGVGGGGLDMDINTTGWKVFESFEGEEIDIIEGDYVLAICLDDILNFEINYVSLELVEEATLVPAADPLITMSPTLTATMQPTMLNTMSPDMIPAEEAAAFSNTAKSNKVSGLLAVSVCSLAAFLALFHS